MVGKPVPNPHRHTAAFRAETSNVVNPTVSTVGSLQGGTPHARGAGDSVCMAYIVKSGAVVWYWWYGLFSYTACQHQKRTPHHAPRERGVLPCIKPTVEKLPTAVRQIGQTAKRVCPVGVRARWGAPESTVGVTTRAFPPRNAAEWRCGFTPTHASLMGSLSPIATPFCTPTARRILRLQEKKWDFGLAMGGVCW